MASIIISGQVSTFVAAASDKAPAKATLTFSSPNPNKKDEMMTIAVLAFGKAIQLLADQASENAFVVIEGRLQVEPYTDLFYYREHIYQIVAARFHKAPESLQLNSVFLTGRTGSEPYIKYFESGDITAWVSVASNRAKNVTDWFETQFLGTQAEVMANYVRKGDLIGVTGQLDFDFWNDRKTGALHHKLYVRSTSLTRLAASKRKSDSVSTSVGTSSIPNFDEIPFG